MKPALLPFVPTKGLANAHAQTIWPSLFRRSRSLPLIREAWPRRLPDVGVVDMALLPYKPNKPGVLLLHGLEGSADASYLRGMMAALDSAEFNVAALEFHSCGPSPPSSPQLYHSGRTDEIAVAVERLTALWPGQRMAACGFSLGGNALLKYLGERQDRSPLVAAVGISVPFDLEACAANLDAPGFFAGVYRKRFLKSLRRKAIEATKAFEVSFTADQVRECQSFRQFDDLVTAPMFGFANADDYWARNSSKPFLTRIVCPTLLISAEDDPFIPASSLPLDINEHNPKVRMELCQQGGHTGFMAGSPWKPDFWAESLTVAFLQEHLLR
jgi:uncharacterized protein